MDSPLTIADFDTSKLNSRIEELHDALIGQGQSGDMSGIFRDEARLFLRQVIRLTPPKTKQQGEDAISRDLMKIFTPVNQDMLDDLVIAHGANNIDTWLTTAGGEKKHIKWTYADNTGGPMASWHQKKENRNRRGRTYNLKKQKGDAWYAPYAVSFENFAAYAKKVKARVGRRKAGWGKSLVGMGGKVGGWINRHVAGAKGELQLGADPERPSIVMVNRAPGIADDERIVRAAIRIRTEAITKRIRLVISGYSKDVARGIKVQRQTRVSPDSLQEVA
jgi:hypothetical protein